MLRENLCQLCAPTVALLAAEGVVGRWNKDGRRTGRDNRRGKDEGWKVEDAKGGSGEKTNLEMHNRGEKRRVSFHEDIQGLDHTSMKSDGRRQNDQPGRNQLQGHIIRGYRNPINSTSPFLSGLNFPGRSVKKPRRQSSVRISAVNNKSKLLNDTTANWWPFSKKDPGCDPPGTPPPKPICQKRGQICETVCKKVCKEAPGKQICKDVCEKVCVKECKLDECKNQVCKQTIKCVCKKVCVSDQCKEPPRRPICVCKNVCKKVCDRPEVCKNAICKNVCVKVCDHPDKMKEAPKKEPPKKEVPKKEVPKKEVPKKEVPKKEAPRKEEPKVQQPVCKEVCKRVCEKPPPPKKEAPKMEVPKKEAPKMEVPKKEAPKKEPPKKEAPKKESQSEMCKRLCKDMKSEKKEDKRKVSTERPAVPEKKRKVEPRKAACVESDTSEMDTSLGKAKFRRGGSKSKPTNNSKNSKSSKNSTGKSPMAKRLQSKASESSSSLAENSTSGASSTTTTSTIRGSSREISGTLEVSETPMLRNNPSASSDSSSSRPTSTAATAGTDSSTSSKINIKINRVKKSRSRSSASASYRAREEACLKEMASMFGKKTVCGVGETVGEARAYMNKLGRRAKKAGLPCLAQSFEDLGQQIQQSQKAIVDVAEDSLAPLREAGSVAEGATEGLLSQSRGWLSMFLPEVKKAKPIVEEFDPESFYLGPGNPGPVPPPSGEN
ncbi:unnamed protein product [Cyprideis torosa]|uniref:Uncharacterized protein n=1 Tax=Cyprideis torosa TaxID=163714 RepID=A0A7R8WBX2_9CRUS|nr:unnamed protein product [Cyprideis torosa]CAG0892773.1 unnamed protein product [Cyprideis torosa]